MEATANRTVCVTGASGFLASWLVKRLLEGGYHVRGTVRDPDDTKKTSHLKKLPGASERLTLHKAELLDEGAFDHIVEGCHGVFHTASAVAFQADDPQRDILDPAVLGTLNVLRACKNSSTVRRVVYTSSASAVRYSAGITPDSILDESFWSSTELCRRNQQWYPLSKTMAEQEALKFAEENNLSLVTVIPSFIVGWVLPEVVTASAGQCLDWLRGNLESLKFFKFMGYVHLDDVAGAHIHLLETSETTGRYICSSIQATNVEILEFLTSKFPEYNFSIKLDEPPRDYKCLSSKKLEDSGFKFRHNTLERMFEDLVQSLKLAGKL